MNHKRHWNKHSVDTAEENPKSHVCDFKHRNAQTSEGTFWKHLKHYVQFSLSQPLTNTVITSAAVDSPWRAKDATRSTVLQLYYNTVNSYFTYTWRRIKIIGYIHHLWDATKAIRHSLINNNTKVTSGLQH